MITAGEEEERIVQAGAAAIRAVLFGDDPDAAEQAVLTHVRNAMNRMEHMEPIDT